MPTSARRSLVVTLAAALPLAACASERGEDAAAKPAEPSAAAPAPVFALPPGYPQPIVEPTNRFAAFPDLRYAEPEGAAPPEQNLECLDLVAPRALLDALVARAGGEPARELGSRPVVVFFHG